MPAKLFHLQRILFAENEKGFPADYSFIINLNRINGAMRGSPNS